MECDSCIPPMDVETKREPLEDSFVLTGLAVFVEAISQRAWNTAVALWLSGVASHSGTSSLKRAQGVERGCGRRVQNQEGGIFS